MARLVIKSDFDGVISAMLLHSVLSIDEVVFAHSEDVLLGHIQLLETDHVVNLPTLSQVASHYWRHEYPSAKEEASQGQSIDFESCVEQIIQDYPQLLQISETESWVGAVKALNTGRLTIEEVRDPKDYLLIGYLMDPMTGMGKKKDFLKSNYYFLQECIESGIKRRIEDWVSELDLLDRIQSYREDQAPFCNMVKSKGQVLQNVLLLDRREDQEALLGNRHLVFTLFDVEVALYCYKGKSENVAVITAVASPFKKPACHLGSVFNVCGGYGDAYYGTIQVHEKEVDGLLYVLIEAIQGTK